MRQIMVTTTLLIAVTQLFAETFYEREFTWDIDGYRYTWEYQFSPHDYVYYHNLPKHLPYAAYAEEHSAYPYLAEFSYDLKELAHKYGFEGYDLVRFVTAFVQHIKYEYDPNVWGDYPRFPIETLVEQKGDCEDSGALLAAILMTMGYDMIMVNPPGHMAVAIACRGCDGSYFRFNGEKYYYIETTQPGWGIGVLPNIYSKDANLIELERTAWIADGHPSNRKDKTIDEPIAMNDYEGQGFDHEKESIGHHWEDELSVDETDLLAIFKEIDAEYGGYFKDLYEQLLKLDLDWIYDDHTIGEVKIEISDVGWVQLVVDENKQLEVSMHSY